MRTKRNLSAHEFDLEALSKYFHLPINEVAKELGVCATVLKKICRRNGIDRWPHRKIKSVDNLIQSLQAVEFTSPEQAQVIAQDIETLKKKRDYLLENPNASYKTVVPKHTILRVQKTTGTGPTASKLDISRAHKRGRKTKRSSDEYSPSLSHMLSAASDLSKQQYTPKLYQQQQPQQYNIRSVPTLKNNSIQAISPSNTTTTTTTNQYHQLPQINDIKSEETSNAGSVLLGSQDELAVMALLNFSATVQESQKPSPFSKSFAQHANSSFSPVLKPSVNNNNNSLTGFQKVNSAFTSVSKANNSRVNIPSCSSSVHSPFGMSCNCFHHEKHTVSSY